MSVRINNTTIFLTRGDTLIIGINLEDADGNEYVPCEQDKIRFALKEKYTDEEPLIIKEIPYDTMTLRLESKDTKKLKMPQDYVYDIQITMSDGTVDTFITKGRLRITEEVD